MAETSATPDLGRPGFEAATHELGWSGAAWWANPAVMAMFFVVPAVLIPFTVSAETFWHQWKEPKVLDGEFLVIAITCLVGLMVGLLPAFLHRDSHGDGSFARVDLMYLASKGPLLLGITVISYATWFALGTLRGANLPLALVHILTGREGDFELIKGPLTPVAGVTTFMQVGVVATSIYVLRLKLGLPRSGWPLTLIVVLALLRTILYAERLAILEVASAAILTHACVRRVPKPGGARRRSSGAWSAGFVRVFPALAPIALVALFGMTEATRSWAVYYSRTQTNFASFTLSRLGGYYATAVNNSALLEQGFPQSHIPIYSTAWFWNMPGVAELLPYSLLSGTDPTAAPGPAASSPGTWLDFLGQAGNPEFNNVGMLSVVWDYGAWLAPLAFTVFGLGMAMLYRRARSGSSVALVSFACLGIAIMELPRFFYIGEGRVTPVILACLLLAAGTRHASAEKASTPDSSQWNLSKGAAWN